MLENCRVCCETTKGTIAKNLFESKQSILLYHIELLTGEWLTNEKNAPIYICKCCEHDLKVAAALRERCIKTQRILRNMKICSSPTLESIDEIKLDGNLIDKNEDSETDQCTESDQYAEYAEYVLDCTGDEQVYDIKDVDQYDESALDCTGEEQVYDFNDSDQYDESILDYTGEEQVDDIIDDEDLYEEDDDFSITSSNIKEEEIQSIEDETELEAQRVVEELKISSPKQPMDSPDRTSPEPPVQIPLPIKRRECINWSVLTEEQAKEMKRLVRRRECVCDQCGRHFNDSSNLKLHLLRHTGIKNYECEVCKAKFYTAHLLKRHSLMHKNSQPKFACQYCGRKFLYNNVRLHHERSHFMDRRFNCEYCDKSFYYKTHQKRHELVHTQIRKYYCETCDQHFLRETHLKAHCLSKSHKNKEQQRK